MCAMRGWVLLGLLLVGCDSKWDYSGGAVTAPDGRTWYRIECKRRADCADRASEVCPEGYIKGEDSDRAAFDSAGNPVAPASKVRTVMVRCASKDDRR